MNHQNQISIAIPNEVIDQVKQHFNDAALLLTPYLFNLTPELLKEIPKMGDKSYAFVTKGLEYLKLGSSPKPNYIDVAELEKDLRAFDTYRQIRQAIIPIIDQIDDSMTLAGSEAYATVLAYYKYIKDAALSNVTGAQSVYNDLSLRFQGRATKKETAVLKDGFA